ncbi:hypothetical protein C8R43DRAFT_1029634 [Mycena crocata]|nr:hypothetical protein C8R43DRAFT_1029634 [Mycena crocata]
MAVLEYVCLRVIHSFHFLIALFSACWHCFHWTPPLPLQVTRRRTPHHLALLLVSDSVYGSDITQEFLLETVNRTVDWCRAVGIEKLTVYDNEGLLVDCADQISQRASAEFNGYESSSGSDVEYPLTPPSSECSDSRPLSPEDHFHKDSAVITMRLPETIHKRTSRFGLKKRHHERGVSKPPLTLCIASRQSSKPAIAAAATSLARRRAGAKDFSLSVEMLNSILEGTNSLSAPDFMILHHLRPSDHSPLPLELYGFPPWQVRLTEIHHCYQQRPLMEQLRFKSRTPKRNPQLLTEIDFRMALDEFAGAEMRFGK